MNNETSVLKMVPSIIIKVKVKEALGSKPQTNLVPFYSVCIEIGFHTILALSIHLIENLNLFIPNRRRIDKAMILTIYPSLLRH